MKVSASTNVCCVEPHLVSGALSLCDVTLANVKSD